MDLEQRIKMAAESILENESLGEGLNDEARSALLDWGVACAKQITSETGNIEDDEEAQEAVYPRMRGLRTLLSAVADLCAENLDEATQTDLFQQIADQVPLVYGPEKTVPDVSTWGNLLAEQAGDASKIINSFRLLFEENTSKEEGEKDAHKKIKRKKK